MYEKIQHKIFVDVQRNIKTKWSLTDPIECENVHYAENIILINWRFCQFPITQ